MHPSTVRTGILGLRRLSLPMQQPFRRAARTDVIAHEPTGPAAALAGRAFGRILAGELNGVPARVFDLTPRGARIELSYPVDVRDATLRVDVDGAQFELRAHVRWYRRYPDGPAAYGLEFAAAPVASALV